MLSFTLASHTIQGQDVTWETNDSGLVQDL